MDVEETWECNYSSHGNDICWPRSYSGRKYDRFVSCNLPEIETRSKPAPIWAVAWRRLIKKWHKNKRMFKSSPCSSSSSSRSCSMRFTYDPYSYSQNFDQGTILADPDDLRRSFSARFAVPSRVFEKNGLMV